MGSIHSFLARHPGNSYILIGVSGLAYGFAVGYAFARFEQHFTKKKMQAIDDNMKFVGCLTDLFIYPVKSCRPVAVNEVQTTPLGLVSGNMRDRTFMITDEKYHFLTARQEGSMVLIQPSFHDDQLWLDAPGMITLKLNIPQDKKSKSAKIRIFGQNTLGIDCGEEAAKWLSKYFKRAECTVRLVYHLLDHTEREHDSWQIWKHAKKNDMGAYSDLCAFNLLNQRSVDDLNTRLKNTKVTSRNFRPNFLLNGTEPYEEDRWQYIRIGSSSQFRCVMPCTRCVFTTIDPETGIRSSDGDPLNTLKTYRKVPGPQRKVMGESPMFGNYLGLDRPGVIRVGDPVFASV